MNMKRFCCCFWCYFCAQSAALALQLPDAKKKTIFFYPVASLPLRGVWRCAKPLFSFLSFFSSCVCWTASLKLSCPGAPGLFIEPWHCLYATDRVQPSGAGRVSRHRNQNSAYVVNTFTQLDLQPRPATTSVPSHL